MVKYIFSFLFIFFSCQSGPGPNTPIPGDQDYYEQDDQNPFILYEESLELEQNDEFVPSLEKLLRAFYFLELASSLSSREAALYNRIQNRLEDIENALFLIPQDNWLEGGLSLTRPKNLNADQFLQPELKVFRAGPEGQRIPIPQVPISFTFLRGEGEVERRVFSDESGTAKTTIKRFSSENTDASIRAQIVFQIEDRDFPFGNAFLDFHYRGVRDQLIYFGLENKGGVWSHWEVDKLGDIQWLEDFGPTLEPLAGTFAPRELVLFSTSTLERIRGVNNSSYAAKVLFFTEEGSASSNGGGYSKQGRVEVQFIHLQDNSLLQSFSTDRIRVSGTSRAEAETLLLEQLSQRLRALSASRVTGVWERLWGE